LAWEARGRKLLAMAGLQPAGAILLVPCEDNVTAADFTD